MGCSKCKQKKSEENKNKVSFKEVDGKGIKTGVPYKDDGDIKTGFGANIIDGFSELAPQNFFIKLIVFIALIIVLPMFLIYLFFFLLKALFFPNNKSLSVTFNRLIDGVTYPFVKIREIGKRIKSKSRQKEFEKNRGYDGDSELLNIEVFEPSELKEKRSYTGEEELDGIEIIENTTNTYNDKDEK